MVGRARQQGRQNRGFRRLFWIPTLLLPARFFKSAIEDLFFSCEVTVTVMGLRLRDMVHDTGYIP